MQLVVYKRGSKAKERKGEERQRYSELYTIFRSRDCSCLPFTAAICRTLPFSSSAVILPPPPPFAKACPQALCIHIKLIKRSCLYVL